MASGCELACAGEEHESALLLSELEYVSGLSAASLFAFESVVSSSSCLSIMLQQQSHVGKRSKEHLCSKAVPVFSAAPAGTAIPAAGQAEERVVMVRRSSRAYVSAAPLHRLVTTQERNAAVHLRHRQQGEGAACAGVPGIKGAEPLS